MTTAAEVGEAFRAIAAAEENYRTLLRAAKAEKVPEKDVMAETGRSHEQLRQDRMTEEQLAEVRRADAERKRVTREKAAGVKTA